MNNTNPLYLIEAGGLGNAAQIFVNNMKEQGINVAKTMSTREHL